MLSWLMIASALGSGVVSPSDSASAANAPVTALATRAAACKPPLQSDSGWDGIGVVRGGKGYVTTPMGQVHYRLMGPSDGPTVLLLHQTPWSLIEWADIQPCLAARGIRTLAIDAPGYGMSDVPDGKPTIRQYAANLAPVLDQLGISRVTVAGHHTGAATAAAFAAQFPDRVAGVVLHGAPNYNAQERAQRLALPHPDLTLRPDGSHLSNYFGKLYRAQGEVPRHLSTITWSTLNIFLAGAADVAHAAVYNNDMGADLAKIEVPLLVLSDAGDALHAIDQRTGKMKPNFSYQTFSQGSAHGLIVEPARWAETVGTFVRKLPAR
ncbi:alpha/beta hydrolase [uncultured Sphingomonas sp.]|uniref:alpha/beta fold hydrolase n=1 Tax=Sphingomonas sp. 179-A 2A2 NHS TaxID=3374290 RepID=UPI0025FD7298|nr:alpha/beta hydrolase [uncultured Sphingomonas sp.]